jgi:DNA-directed RNA polymerase specialized sigma subunit
MTAREYLGQLYQRDIQIDSRLAELERLQELSTQITTRLRPVAVQGGRRADRVASTIAKMVDLDNEINDEVDAYVDLQAEMRGRIDALCNEDYRILLRLRYINYMTWEQIAEQMGRSTQWVYVLHKRALEDFARVYRMDDCPRKKMCAST